MCLRARYDWDRYDRPRVALGVRIGAALIAGMAALSWPMFLIAALHDWTLILVPPFITAGAVVQRAAMRKVYGVPAEPDPVPEPGPRTPLDLDRPYPRPKGGRRKPDRTCPVCGTGAETTALDGKVLGWRAHGSCAEWLGDWQPPSRSQMDAGLQKAVDAFGSVAHTAGTYMAQPAVVPRGTSYSNTICTGGTVATIGALTGGAGGSSSLDSMALTNNVAAVIRQQLASGQVSVEEARERIISAFGVPGPVLGDAVDEAALGHLVALQEMFLDSEMRATAKAIERGRRVRRLRPADVQDGD